MNSPPSRAQSRIAELLATYKLTQQKESNAQTISKTTESSLPRSTESNSNAEKFHELSSETDNSRETETISGTDKFGNAITYNKEQSEFISLASSGVSCILIGAAGTGKTTSQKGAISQMIESNLLGVLNAGAHKHLTSGTPGIAIVAYTRRATNNIRRNLSADLQSNCLTIHKLLEYQPVYYTDEATGKDTMRFEATRNAENPLPSSIRTIVIEESSMVAVSLFKELELACPHNPQYIFLGDIQQLPPVFGSAILGFKMLELPTIELIEVYRQALNSPIIRLAHRILSGKPMTKDEFSKVHVSGELTIHPWAKRISPDSATSVTAKFFVGETKPDGTYSPGQLQKGLYNPETDAILLPFNKSYGTIELNNHIANAIAKKEQKLVYEIIHGFKKSYYSIGDKVLYDREDAIIRDIYINPEYAGVSPQSESVSLDYWGNKPQTERLNDANFDIDNILAQVSHASHDEDRVNQCSHVITLELLDSEKEIKIKDSGAVNNLLLGYAITVHKGQGSEWDKVYLCLHSSHATMLQRELLYTAVTRAKKELFIICEPDSFERGILNQRIKGDTLIQKAEFFKGKLERGELQS